LGKKKSSKIPSRRGGNSTFSRRITLKRGRGIPRLSRGRGGGFGRRVGQLKNRSNTRVTIRGRDRAHRREIRTSFIPWAPRRTSIKTISNKWSATPTANTGSEGGRRRRRPSRCTRGGFAFDA